MPRSRLPTRLGLLLAGLLAAASVDALALDLKKIDLKKKYEEELIRWALKQAGLQRDPSPEGKKIERIEIVREEIIAQSDPWPNFLNWFHVKTKDFVVRQELLVAPGEVWDEEKVEESARNLRKLFILAVVRTVPCRSKKPGHVVLLVVTKDLWSLRLNTIFSQVGGVLQRLEFFPTEMNFLGRNKRVSIHLRMEQLSWSPFELMDQMAIGQLYIDHRLLGTRWKLMEWVDLVLSGKVPCGGSVGSQQQAWCPDKGAYDPEGMYALLWLSRPLYALDTKWGFNASFSVNMRQRRRFRGRDLRTDLNFGNALRPAIPRVYDLREFSGGVDYTRSYGVATKHDLTAGLSAYSLRYSHPESMRSVYTEAMLEWHARNFLPRSEEATSLWLRYRTHSPRFVRLRDIQGFALSEDYSLGHNLQVQANIAANLEAIEHSFLVLSLTAQYQWYFYDDLLRIWLSASGRMQPGLEELGYRELGFSGSWANNIFSVGLRNVSPLLWVGRLHLRAQAQIRHNDMDRQRNSLGGGSGLRGYLADQFEGDNLLQLNLEYRSRPINVLTLHLGFVVFYDAGGVFGGPDPYRPGSDLPFRYHHSIGAGVRGHFPQFDKESLRIDFGIPLSSDRPSVGNWFTLAFAQVF